MKILCVDVGTGTQDILLYDTDRHPENAFKMVVPSPTMIVHRRLQAATQAGQAVLLTGLTMGGGPSHWAAENHMKAGLDLFATPSAARSFNDDLVFLQEQGIQLVSDDEAAKLNGHVVHLSLRDFDYGAIRAALKAFGVGLDDLAAVGVAVFDHGNAPADVSDRKFRFDFIADRLAQDRRLSTFAFHAADIPAVMTRMQAVVQSAVDVDAPLIVMDTAPAAIAGALLDDQLSNKSRLLVVNVGNLHTLAFRMGARGIEGSFEHHTGMLDGVKLDGLLLELAAGTLKNEDIFNDHGHGALILEEKPYDIADEGFGVAVIGPRRRMMKESALRPYFATPFGDMMMAGCFGLLTGVAERLPDLKRPIGDSFSGAFGRPPWE